MAAGDSLFVQNDGAAGLSAQEARLALMGQWATGSANPLDVRTGLVFDGRTQLLTGTGGLSVNVAAFHFVANKGGLNGIYQGCNNSTTAVTVPAAPSLGNKRTDLIWVEQQDKNAVVDADASTQVAFGVVTGTATAGTPSKPALPAGTAEVGTVTWDSSSVVATATNAAQCTLTTTGPWTVTRGAPIPVRNAAERNSTLTPYVGMQVLRLDASSRVERWDGTGWLTEVYGMDTVVTTNGSGEFSLPTGLTTILFATVYNGNGGLVRAGNRQNVTIARNSSGASYTGGTLTGIVFAADTKVGVASTSVRIDWMAKGYS